MPCCVACCDCGFCIIPHRSDWNGVRMFISLQQCNYSVSYGIWNKWTAMPPAIHVFRFRVEIFQKIMCSLSRSWKTSRGCFLQHCTFEWKTKIRSVRTHIIFFSRFENHRTSCTSAVILKDTLLGPNTRHIWSAHIAWVLVKGVAHQFYTSLKLICIF